MTDIALTFDDDLQAIDLAVEGGDLATDEGLRTAILVSLFTDARASTEDILPQPGADRRGWWGDALAEIDGDEIGSKLWLVDREKITADAITRAREYAVAATAWLVDDKVASRIEVDAEAIRPQTMALTIWVYRPTGPARQRYDFVWDMTQ
ncbi:MAG: phage GP46 family protein [Pseudomonadota bacterium]